MPLLKSLSSMHHGDIVIDASNENCGVHLRPYGYGVACIGVRVLRRHIRRLLEAATVRATDHRSCPEATSGPSNHSCQFLLTPRLEMTRAVVVTNIGTGGSGHFVNMIHNGIQLGIELGIEHGIMSALGEASHLPDPSLTAAHCLRIASAEVGQRSAVNASRGSVSPLANSVSRLRSDPRFLSNCGRQST